MLIQHHIQIGKTQNFHKVYNFLCLFNKYFVLKSNKLLMIYHISIFHRCSGCDSLFPSLMLLEHHKEEFEHW